MREVEHIAMSNTGGCVAAAPTLTLKLDEVHVWGVSVDPETYSPDWYLQTLSGDECARANRFHFHRDRLQYIVARALLRELLGDYLHCAPEDLQFGYSEYGKPYLIGQHSTIDLYFNVSHSGNLVLYAFSSSCEVGIDVEKHSPGMETTFIAKHFFTPRERGVLEALTGLERGRLFLEVWTRKEAYAKAYGVGLSMPLDEIDTTRDQVRSFLADVVDPRCTIRTLDVHPSYAAAVAVRGTARNVTCRWHPSALQLRRWL